MQVSSRNLLKALIFAAHLASVTAKTPGDGPQAPTFLGHSYLSDLIFSPVLPPFSWHTTSCLSPASRGPSAPGPQGLLPCVRHTYQAIDKACSSPPEVLDHPPRSFISPGVPHHSLGSLITSRGPSSPPRVLHHPPRSFISPRILHHPLRSFITPWGLRPVASSLVGSIQLPLQPIL